ncbi:hypothetical protein B0H10DRAFT_1958030 [Mycena sp. CBHHK59/15]|nr:hypothetical protein B0H10DRAFT_1958030 [Mycena sp. CBHHK59/15]
MRCWQGLGRLKLHTLPCNGHNYSKIKLPAVPGAHKNLGKPTIHALRSVSKRIQAKVEKDGKKHTACKGAPTRFCSLGIATEEDRKDWKLFRIMSMFDPPTADPQYLAMHNNDLKPASSLSGLDVHDFVEAAGNGFNMQDETWSDGQIILLLWVTRSVPAATTGTAHQESGRDAGGRDAVCEAVTFKLSIRKLGSGGNLVNCVPAHGGAGQWKCINGASNNIRDQKVTFLEKLRGKDSKYRWIMKEILIVLT